MLDSDDKKIFDVLNATKLVVPKYQRAYDWKKSEAEELWDDLYSYFSERKNLKENTGNLFLGTFIFHSKSDQEYEIVDGQQRITSIFILLVAIRMRLVNLDHEARDNQLAAIKGLLRFTDAAGGGDIEMRLTPSRSITQLFKEMVKDDWDGDFDKNKSLEYKKQVRKIKPIYDYFKSEVDQLDPKDFYFFLKALYETKIVQITINRIEDAFAVFERTNSRGMDLEASDLLKNYLFSMLSNDPNVDFETEWENIHIRSDGTILRMIKYFYVSQKGSVSRSQLYRAIQRLDKTPIELMSELNEFSKFYQVMRDSNINEFKDYINDIGLTELAKHTDRSFSIFSSIQGLRYMKITQIYPLIYSILDSFKRNNLLQIDKFKKTLPLLFKNIENYHFINNLILDRVGNEVEKPYANFARDFANSTEDNFNEILKRFYTFLKSKIANKEEFIPRFIELSYNDPYQTQLYIFDRIYNYSNNKTGEVSASGYVEIFNPEKKLKDFDFTLEHWLPQKHQANLENPDKVHNIGNLLMLSGRLNSSLNNEMPEVKAKIISENTDAQKEVSRTPYVREFIDSYQGHHQNWCDSTILERANELAMNAYTKVWKFEPPL